MTYSLQTRPAEGNAHYREIALGGRVYADAAPELRAALEQAVAGADTILVDASALEQIDAVALRTFVDVLKHLRPRNGRLLFFGLHPTIRRTFELTHLDEVVSIAADRNEALRAIA